MGTEASRTVEAPPPQSKDSPRTITTAVVVPMGEHHVDDGDSLLSGETELGGGALFRSESDGVPSLTSRLPSETTSIQSGPAILNETGAVGLKEGSSQMYFEGLVRLLTSRTVPSHSVPITTPTTTHRQHCSVSEDTARRPRHPQRSGSDSVGTIQYKSKLYDSCPDHESSRVSAAGIQVPLSSSSSSPVRTSEKRLDHLTFDDSSENHQPTSLPPAHPPSSSQPALVGEERSTSRQGVPSRSFSTTATPAVNVEPLPYWWYSWPDDALPPAAVTAESIRRSQIPARRAKMDPDASDDDPELLELANRLMRDELEKAERIKQGRARNSKQVLESKEQRGASEGFKKTTSSEALLIEKLDSSFISEATAATVMPPPPQDDELLVPYAFSWSQGGHSIYLTGSFDNWSTEHKMKLVRSGHEFIAIKELPRAVHYYKFIVDDQWKFSPTQPTHTDEHGNVNNVLDLTDYQLYNFTVPKEHEQAREAAYHQFVPGSNDYTTDAPVIPILLGKSHCVAADPPSRISGPLHALSNHLYHDSHAAHLFGPHIASVTSTQRWRHSHISALSSAGLRFSTLIYVTFNPLFLLHGDASFELYAASPLRSLLRYSRNQIRASGDSSTVATVMHHPTNHRPNPQVQDSSPDDFVVEPSPPVLRLASIGPE